MDRRDDPEPPPTRSASGGPTTLHFVLGLGAAEVAIIYALLAFDTPLSAFASRAAESWPGRIMLALVGWLVISAGMIVLLTILERRASKHDAGP